jgi:hypothetical protein
MEQEKIVLQDQRGVERRYHRIVARDRSCSNTVLGADFYLLFSSLASCH